MKLTTDEEKLQMNPSLIGQNLIINFEISFNITSDHLKTETF